MKWPRSHVERRWRSTLPASMLSLLQDTVATPVPVGIPLASVLLLGGLAALLLGGHALVDGAAALARRLGVSPLMVGLTIVAFGTSAPELALNVIAVAASPEGAELAWGNVVGSNMANIALVLGLACLLMPLRIQGQALHRDLPLLQGVTVVFIVLLLVTPHVGEHLGLSRIDGGVLLAGFVAVAAVWYISGQRQKDGPLAREATAALHESPKSIQASIGLIIGGLVLLLGGAWAGESGAVDIARHFGVPEVIIGLTIVAVGTSLPEVATAIIAARRNETDLAVGTVIGSNLFNLVLVMGVSALIRPIPMPPGGMISLAAMLAFTVSLLVVYAPGRRLSRAWGATMLIAWVGVITWIAVTTT